MQYLVSAVFSTIRPSRSRTPSGRALASWLVAAALGFTLPHSQPIAGEIDTGTCLKCHGIDDFAGSEGKSLFVDEARFSLSSHASVGCQACHSGAAEVPHPDELAAVEPTVCAKCHSGADQDTRASIHGGAGSGQAAGAPTCVSCHGPPHEIRSATDPASPVYHLKLPRTCGNCHSKQLPDEGQDTQPAKVYDSYIDSIHGRAIHASGLLVAANCSSCHGYHDIKAKHDPASPVSRANIASTCGACHEGIEAQYLQGSHGRLLQAGDLEVPSCAQCHTEHEICRVANDPCKLDAVRECGTCHEESLRTYRDTLHGQVTALGFSRVARCSDCHGPHRVLPSSDPESPTAPVNLVATCQACHPRANDNFVQYSPHADPDDPERDLALYYAARFMHALIIGVFAFFGLHTILWFLRSAAESARARRRTDGLRGRGNKR